MNASTILRGRLLSFYRRPEGIDDQESYFYESDGALVIETGKIIARGTFDEIRKKHPGYDVIDHRPHLILPGFIDAHAHFPQVHVIASFGTKLLKWLNSYTFPEEQKFADKDHAARVADHFFDCLINHGTTTVAAYSSSHKAATEILFKAAERRNFCLIGGKVMMDRGAPDALCDTAQTSYDDSKALIEKWHGKGRNHYAITPRFAITSTPEQLELAGALSGENPDCFVQTHLSENDAEIQLTKELYPAARDYLDVYETYSLLGSKTLLGHSIHLSEREIKKMAETRSVAVFCPTSNLFLGSGLFDEEGLREKGVRIAAATDVGGGTNYSMLRTMDEGYKILQLRDQIMDALQSFYLITRGNAEALSLTDNIGTLEPSSDADIVVLNAAATPEMALRMETVDSLHEELFLLQTLGDDRAIIETYVAGQPMKS